MTYRDALNFIYSFTNFEVTPANTYSSKTFDLIRMERLLAALDNPHTKFKSIHVAGTKGKGSTSAIIESILRAAGYSTGLYTSPHLHTFRERIRADGKIISQDDLVAGVEKIKPVVALVPDVTAFEVMTALAFDYFAARGVAFAVLEVGLGGRLDATNVVTPVISVITSISLDHMAILGDTLAQIASEKAGIIKPGIPVVSSPQKDEARIVVEQVAKKKNAPLAQISDFRFQISDLTFQITPIASSLDGQTFQLSRLNLKPETGNVQPVSCDLKLLGKHQLTNATTALATVSVLRANGIDISDDAMRDGISRVEWHGRFEILSRSPFLILDGAHNADSARQLVATLREFFPTAQLHFVFGVSSDKDIAGIFRELLPHAASLTLTRSHNPRAADPGRLAELSPPYIVETVIQPDLASAIESAIHRAEPTDVVCVTGSLFVVAQAREIWLTQQGIQVEIDE